MSGHGPFDVLTWSQYETVRSPFVCDSPVGVGQEPSPLVVAEKCGDPSARKPIEPRIAASISPQRWASFQYRLWLLS